MIGVFTLILLITGAIDSIRNLPTTALFGSSLFFFFSLSALIFLCPVCLVAAELASTFSEEEGGIFTWVNHAFGQRWAFFTVWLHLIIVILTVFWGLTFLALRGLRASAFFAGFCAILGMILPVGFIIGLAFYWWYLGKPLAIDLSLAS